MNASRFRRHAGTALIRTRAFWAAAATSVSVLAAFLLAWGDGMPSLTGSVLRQTIGVQTMTLAVVLPWAASRGKALSRPAILRLATITAQSPARLLIARALGIGAALAGLALTGVPMVLLARQISDAPFSAMMGATLPIVTMIPFVAVLATWCQVLFACRLTAWLVTAAITLALALASGSTGTMLFAIGALTGLGALGSIGDRVLRQPAPVMSTRHV